MTMIFLCGIKAHENRAIKLLLLIEYNNFSYAIHIYIYPFIIVVSGGYDQKKKKAAYKW